MPTALPLAATPSAALTLPQDTPLTARRVLRLLQRLRVGVLTVQLPDGSQHRFGQAHEDHAGSAVLHAHLHLHNWKVFSAALKSGDIGFAESFIAGDWSTPDLVGLLALLSANRQALESVVYGNWLGRLAYRIKHLMQRNSRAGSRKNIHAHYDLGNDFYRLWLDETMNYSSAWFNGNPELPLPLAQTAKVCRALDECDVQIGDRVLEIGCGWGALAEQATVQYAASVVGVTLSTEQLAWANARLRKLGIGTGPGAQADLRLQDYRDITDAPFDAICSIEMVEAVGQEYWPQYFQTVQRLLKDGGKACIQSIVIRDDLFERYVKSTDFIQQYIFPGGCLPSPQAFRAQASAAGLRVINEISFGGDYARTLHQWRAAFHARRQEVLALGFDERFLRIWDFYLAYCEAAFQTGDIELMQFTLQK
ncbi:cyclopropane-fatty-acyl-phospholipid synthase family protein [Curvibacter sp. APW13]|uniref:cyclopropane-fatty-acyl-phospholipid synthase family protein n=1 Tax=Curvibacter sp. APW13 TaxID=3077236 RepID=UPI0028DE8FBE|nr:cyclopropane-fatty-acyl-phospholipid synthase family protein [Curvibacter sp. APW13]MDT8990416.1 cyclopropane-fatty-acyl-phospholipid synthase family protein [Curvibacter sp. APW13]